jgi:hypothetical protein
MALDFFSIPATSCECERCFSSAKRTVITDRNGLLPITMEALQLQKNWVRQGLCESELTKLSASINRAEKPLSTSDDEGDSEWEDGDLSESPFTSLPASPSPFS